MKNLFSSNVALMLAGSPLALVRCGGSSNRSSKVAEAPMTE